MKIGKVHSETRVPFAPAFSVVTRQVSYILDRAAEAGWTDHRTVGTGQTTLRDLLPDWMCRLGRQQSRNPAVITSRPIPAAVASICREAAPVSSSVAPRTGSPAVSALLAHSQLQAETGDRWHRAVRSALCHNHV
jgi:hypothetical protein